jgi:hypothetical protein
MLRNEKMRHQDFNRIRNEFINYYKGSVAKGEEQYYQWLNALHLDERLCYSQTHEKFMWAKDMLKTVGEDAENKYYKVLVAFPLESMNGNIYKEADLQEDARSVTKGHPSLNHKDEYRFCPESKWGAVYVTGAEYEDGAVEALLKVPKTTICPVTGEKLYTVIDQKRIVNVSLEGFTANNGRFHFNESIPFTLLMSNILPGIPLARIFPIEQRLEAFLPGLQSHNYKRTIKIIGLEKNMDKPDNCPKCGKPLIDGKCPNCNPETDDKKENVEPYATSTVNPIKPVVTNAGTDSKGGTGMFTDENDKKMILGESVPALKVKALKAEQKATLAEKKLAEATQAYDLSKAELETKLTEAYQQNSKMQGQITQLESQVSKLEAQTTMLNTEKIHDGTEVKSLQRRLEDMTQSRDQYIKQYGDLKTEHEKITAKYRETLSNNLELEKKLTETNEEYLGIAKKAENLEDKIKHVNRITHIKATF